LKLAADASVGAFNLLSDSGSYRFGSLDESSRSIAIALAAFSALSTAAVMSPAGPRGKENPKTPTRVRECYRAQSSPLGAEIPLDLRLAISYFTLGLDQHTLC